MFSICAFDFCALNEAFGFLTKIEMDDYRGKKITAKGEKNGKAC